MLQSNIDKLALRPCKGCNTFSEDRYCGHRDHWVITPPAIYTHFCIQGKWYVLPQKYVRQLLSLIEVDTAMQIAGAMYRPNPVRISNLTDLFSLLRKLNVTEEQLATQFPPEQVARMAGRVFKRLVKGR